MKLSVSAYRAHASAHKKILSNSYQSQFNYGSTAASSGRTDGLFTMENTENNGQQSINDNEGDHNSGQSVLSPTGTVISTSETPASKDEEDDSSNAPSSDCKSPSQRTKSNQRWMKLRTTVQISSAIQKKPPLKREDSFLKRFSTRQIPETQETVEDTGSESASGDHDKTSKRRRRYLQKRRSVVNPDENFYFYWLMVLTFSILYNLWTLIVRQSFPELQEIISKYWFICDCATDVVFILDIAFQLRTGYLEQGLMVYDDKKLACHYMHSKEFLFDLAALIPLDLLQLRLGSQPLLRFPRFLKVYRSIKFYYIVESRTVWPNLWRVVNLIHILLILAHWFGCFYFLLSEAEGFQGDWVYPYRQGDYATLTRKYLGSLYWSTLTLTTIGDLPTPETNAEYIFTIVSYLIGVFIFATIVGQVGNVITNRNANRLEFERLLDGAKTYMRHHKVPGGMKRRVLRWYDYSWSRGRIQGGGDINTALGLLPDKLKTELALHVNLSVLKKVTIFQECQPEFLHDLVLKMKAYIFTPGDSICRKGEVAREMFIIADGILEVLSETGKVLTTMKAGDFFGEIGILNLDGLNKRTADVRSVGYSELFSLSREDVLAAMKDYPEAQEILQTLGRKRLMEVRCVNKKHAKAAASEKEGHHFQTGHTDNSSENSTSKKLVEKLRSDVKGIKSVLRKSRTSRRSNESLEMQPLHGLKSSKCMLRRMPRVRSDDFNNEHDEHIDFKDKTPSPIGAGLPLLQRLRLLKEKQDREERAPKPSHVTSAVSPQESIQEEPPEPEVIGAGLPLFERLQLLKAKEEKLAKESQPEQANNSQSSTMSTMKIPIKHSPTSTIISPQNIVSPFVNPLGNSPSCGPKPTLKVSFKAKIKEMQNASPQNIDKEYKQIEPSSLKEKLIPTISSICSKPSTTTALKDKLKYLSQPQKEETLKPWSKLKLATIVSSGSYSSLTNYTIDDDRTIDPKNETNRIKNRNETTKFRSKEVDRNTDKVEVDKVKRFILTQIPKKYRSVDDLSPEYSGLPFVKKLKILNERQKLAELESAIQTRSFSLDCAESINLSDINEPLYRSSSDGFSGSIKKSRANILSSTTITVPVTPFNIPQCLSSPLSPESNETLERKQLKSILKKLNEDKLTAAALTKTLITNPQELKGLLQAPTIEGYVARHSKLMKSVTFNSTLSSPPPSDTNDEPNRFTFISMPKNNSIVKNMEETTAIYQDQMDEASSNNNNSASLVPPKTVFKGSTEEQEYCSEVLLGIKNVIQSHMLDIHNKFQDRFLNLELEVKRRDEIIDQLQNKIRQLEIHSNDTQKPSKLMKSSSGQIYQTGNSPGTESSASSSELLFMRGDSLDTITSPSTIRKKRVSPRQRAQKHHQSLESSDQESIEFRAHRGYHVSDGNLRRMSDSVILTIDDSTSSSTSSSKSKLDQDDDASKSEQLLHCDDWEVRMLAAELDRRESQQEPVKDNTSTFTDLDEFSTLLRRRPRASSLDQYNLRHGKCKSVFKAMSFDRDKDRL